MARQIKDIDVKMISLVRSGANRKKIIYKGETLANVLSVNFQKSDDERGVVYGIVYAPDEVDAQGDTASAEEILKAAYAFMKKSNLACVDVEHSLEPVNAYICESWIVKEGDPLFRETGAWAVGIKLEDENLREAVKKGEINGLSMYGSGLVEMKETKKSLTETIKETIRGIFQENQFNQKQEESMNEKQIKELVKSSIDAAIAEVKKGYEERLEALSKQIANLEAEISKSKQTKEPAGIAKSAAGGIL